MSGVLNRRMFQGSAPITINKDPRAAMGVTRGMTPNVSQGLTPNISQGNDTELQYIGQDIMDPANMYEEGIYSDALLNSGILGIDGDSENGEITS